MATSTREEIRVGEMAIRFLLEGDQSDGSVAMFEFEVPAGAKVAAPHSHDGFEETIYGLEGTLVWTVDGQAHEVGPGEVLSIPRGAVPPVRQRRRRRRQGPGDRHPRHPRPSVLPRGRGDPRCSGRRPSRPGCDRRSDPSPWADSRLPITLAEKESTYDPVSAHPSQRTRRLGPR